MQAMQAKSEGSHLPFSCLLKSRIFSTTLTTFFGFSFSGIYFLLKFLNSVAKLLCLLSAFSNDKYMYISLKSNS